MSAAAWFCPLVSPKVDVVPGWPVNAANGGVVVNSALADCRMDIALR
jgi:hypothetical protein